MTKGIYTIAAATIATFALFGSALAGESSGKGNTYSGWTSGGGSASASTDCGCTSNGRVSATGLSITASAGAGYSAGKDTRAGGLGLNVSYANVHGAGGSASASGGYSAGGKAPGNNYGRSR
jgi:hypothetical protein